MPMPMAAAAPPSVGMAPIVVAGDDRIPGTQNASLKVFDSILSFEDEVREYSQTCASPDSIDDTAVTFHQDSDFVSTSVDDVCKCPQTEDENARLECYLPSKIVFETRNKFRDAVRLGSDEAGFEALETGLQTLRNQTRRSSDFWRLGEAEILLDLGRKDEARETLAHCDIQPPTRGSIIPLKRPTLRISSSATDAEFEEEMSKFNNQSHKKNQEELLQVLLRAEDWGKAREAAETLHRIDSSYFDIKKPMDRFRKCRQLLNLGLLEETSDPEADTDQTRRSLGKALRLYNHGCFATELFHKHFDYPEAQVNGFDHSDCANLFFSAARVCIFFHQNGVFNERGESLTPKKFTSHFKRDLLPCSPALTEEDWMHQAFHFMEQGRSRALLESILKGGPDEPLVTGMQRRFLMADVAFAATESLRKHKRDSLLSVADPRSATKDASVSPDNSLQDFSLLDLNDNTPPRPSVMDALPAIFSQRQGHSPSPLPVLDTAGLEPDTYVETPPSSPASFAAHYQGTNTEGKTLAIARARMRWRRAYFAVKNPTLNAALPNSSFTKDFSEIRGRIPEDTAVVEYALVTAPPEGLISLVITSNGIEKCTWQKIDTVQKQVADLLDSMYSPNAGTRDTGPTSPRRGGIADADELREGLFNTLIRPIEGPLAGKKKLIIIPSGALAHVPWTMLLEIPIAVSPSLSIWNHLHTNPPDDKGPSKVSVVGNPPRNEDGTLRDGDIPFSHVEAFYIARMHKELPFLAGENNRKKFQERVALTRVLHLCAHSTFDNEDPARSGIQLFQEPLTIHDWRDLAIKADLVVFSSCLSGISKAFHSGSSFGFAHTLLGTGTRAFIGSLWPVDDQATLFLMMIFYENLQTLCPAEALHNAQMKMRDLSREDVWALVERLKKEGKDRIIYKFVDRPKYWIRRLDNLDEEELQKLREPRCWAAFVLTGYGFQPI
jgi:CHAT domain-containing protein